MLIRFTALAGSVMLALLSSAGVGSAASPMLQASSSHGEDAHLPNGVIGVSMQVGAERIGDPAVLYVAMVHPEGPAQQGGLAHGDQIVTVDGTAVSGKTYEQVVLGVKGEGGTRELSLTRVASETLSKGPSGSHKTPSR